MDGDPVGNPSEDPEPQPEKKESIAEQFWRVLPWYKSIGCSFDEFWNGDIRWALMYRDDHYLTIERRNQEMHLQGMYDMMAIAACFSDKGKVKYPNEPFRITPYTEDELERKEKESNELFLLQVKMRQQALLGTSDKEKNYAN